ncbi:MAG TPA: DUF5671 domain-containing protein [Candidatus Paceibacterota bacterium]
MNTKTTPRDFFLHLGATVVLYVAVIALLNLFFSVINFAYPDTLAGYYSSNTIATPISMLIVLIPLLYVLEWVLVRDVRRIPEKADLWIRRWRIHLTLFLSGATIIGDVIALVNTYLSGEITVRFAWKILATLVVCGVVFAYYLLTRVTTEQRGRIARKTLAIIGAVVAILAIVLGFLIVGSPQHQRDIRFDNQRVSDLSNIQWQIISEWQRMGALPQTLDQMKDALSYTVIPNDPQTGKPYEYVVKGKTSFDLCTTFALKTQDTKGRGEYGGRLGYGMGGGLLSPIAVSVPSGGSNIDDNWTHDAGHACFSRTIDPARFPVNPTPKG